MIAMTETTVVNKEKYVTETSGWQRCPIIRIDVYAEDAPRTPIIAMIMAIMRWFWSASPGFSLSASIESVPSPASDRKKAKGRAIKTTPINETNPANCCLRVKISPGRKIEQA
jgi:hypothetical protein